MHISYKLKKERCAGIRMGMWTFLQMGVNFFLPPWERKKCMFLTEYSVLKYTVWSVLMQNNTVLGDETWS